MDTSFQRTVASSEWYTPKDLIDSLGRFDLDPCAPVHPLWPTADRMINKEEDGLISDWGGANIRVFCNPPYEQPLLSGFCKKMVSHGNGILLLFARVDNILFQELLLPSCDALLFLRHRVKFFMPDGHRGGSPGCGSVLMAFGQNNVQALMASGQEGFLMIRNGEWKHIKIL